MGKKKKKKKKGKRVDGTLRRVEFTAERKSFAANYSSSSQKSKKEKREKERGEKKKGKKRRQARSIVRRRAWLNPNGKQNGRQRDRETHLWLFSGWFVFEFLFGRVW
jgi:hypothetical protein